MFCGKSCFVSKMKLSNYKKCPMQTIIDNYIEISVMKIEKGKRQIQPHSHQTDFACRIVIVTKKLGNPMV